MLQPELTPETFLSDPDFRSWVIAPTPELTDRWQTFSLQHPAAQPAMAQARAVLGYLHEQEAVNLPTDEQVRRLKDGIQARLAEESPVIRPLWVPRWRWVAAASLLLAVGIGWRVQTHYRSSVATDQRPISNASTSLNEVVNTSSHARLVSLPDGSTAALQPNSRISYDSASANPDRREVYLTGDAFFTVTKNPKRPFLVYADKLVTKVLGTSFWVKASAQQKYITVAVRTGKVAVFNQNDKEASQLRTDRTLGGMVLTPNQQVVFTRSNERLQRTLVDTPALLLPAARTPSFVYQDRPVGQVFDELAKAYGVDILYDRLAMTHCLLTASLADESLYEKLRLICKSIQAQYVVQDGQIIITGIGCS